MTNHAAQLAIIKHVTRQESRSSAGSCHADEPAGKDKESKVHYCQNIKGDIPQRIERGCYITGIFLDNMLKL